MGLTQAQIDAKIPTKVITGGSQTRAVGVREILNDITAGYLNKKDGGLVIAARLGYSTPITPASDYEFSTKKYVDDSVAAVDLTPLWSKAGNILSSRGIFGSISGAFGWDELLNNVVIGGVNNDKSRFYGTTGSFADTNYSFQTLGNNSSTYGFQIQNLGNTHRAWFRNDGLFSASGGLSTDGVKSIVMDTVNNLYKLGPLAGFSSSASDSVFIGNRAGFISSATNSVFLGPESGENATGNSNIGSGYQALKGNIGDHNCGHGAYAGLLNNGSFNSFYGLDAGVNNIGSDNFFAGRESGQNNASSNTKGIGFRAAINNTRDEIFTISRLSDIFWNNVGDKGEAILQTVSMQSAMSVDGTNTSAALSIMSYDAALGTGNASPANITWRHAVVQASGTTRHTKALALTMNGATGEFTFEKPLYTKGDYTAVSATYSVLGKDIKLECTANTFTVTLFTAVTVDRTIRTITNTGAGVITVACTGGQTISGSATVTLNQWETLAYYPNGTNFVKIL